MKPSLTVALGLLGIGFIATTASAEPKRTWVPVKQLLHIPQGAAADTHTIFLNKCASGCQITNNGGNTDSRTDSSSLAKGGTSTLTPYPRSAAHWAAVVSCVKTTFSRWNVTITDVDPGNAAHYEVMVAGNSTDVMDPNSCGGDCSGIGGVAEFPCNGAGNCDPYIPNTIAYDFAKSWSGYPDPDHEDCGTIAQEIAHTWALDHVVDASDPLTYNNYNGMRQYHDNEKCGSDCQGGYGPFGSGERCTGTEGQLGASFSTHVCWGTGTATQNELQTITALFGSSAPDHTPPTVMITAPADGASVMPSFQIKATLADNNGIDHAEMRIDGGAPVTATAFPYVWTAPANLAMGGHTVEVKAFDFGGNTAVDSVSVVYGTKCTSPTDCPNADDTCVSGRCVAGMGTPGGLGSTCKANADCDSGMCTGDGSGNSYCVVSCDPTMQGCPAGFGCAQTDSPTSGVCFPGADSGGGGCNSGSSSSGLLLLGLGLGVVTLTRRRR